MILKRLDAIVRSLAHIELLLQYMPEIIAAEAIIEREHAREAVMAGKRYSETVQVTPPNER